MDKPEQTSVFDFLKPSIQELPTDDELKTIVKARWLSCVCDPYARPQDWLKATEFLGKAVGIFAEKEVKDETPTEPITITGVKSRYKDE